MDFSSLGPKGAHLNVTWIPKIIEFGKPVTFSVDMISRKINSYTMLYLWSKNIKERLINHLVITLILL